MSKKDYTVLGFVWITVDGRRLPSPVATFENAVNAVAALEKARQRQPKTVWLHVLRKFIMPEDITYANYVK